MADQAETPVARQARLRAEIAERDLARQRDDFARRAAEHSEQPDDLASRGIGAILDELENALPDFVAAVRAAAPREGRLVARAWLRDFRRHQAAAFRDQAAAAPALVQMTLEQLEQGDGRN